MRNVRTRYLAGLKDWISVMVVVVVGFKGNELREYGYALAYLPVRVLTLKKRESKKPHEKFGKGWKNEWAKYWNI